MVDAPDDETEEQREEREAHMRRMVEAQGPITTRVPIVDVMDQKVAAMREHVTQFRADGFFLASP